MLAAGLINKGCTITQLQNLDVCAISQGAPVTTAPEAVNCIIDNAKQAASAIADAVGPKDARKCGNVLLAPPGGSGTTVTRSVGLAAHQYA